MRLDPTAPALLIEAETPVALAQPLSAAATFDARTFTRPKAADREAVLAKLYAERAELMRVRRLGALSAHDGRYLQDLEKHIDEWEVEDPSPTDKADVWAKLETLTASVISLQTKIVRQK